MNELVFLSENPELAKSITVKLTGSDLIKGFEELTRRREASTASRQFNERYLTRAETAEMLGVTDVTLWHWAKKGMLRTHKIGRQVRYKLSDITAFMEGGIK